MAKSIALNLNRSNSAYYRWLQAGFIALVIVLMLTGCAPDSEGKGGSGNTSISGLEMATTMSVVTPVDNNFTRQAKDPLLKLVKTFGMDRIISSQNFPTDSDFVTDNTVDYVWDDTSEVMETMNIILCLLDQGAIADMVNKGPYAALIQPSLCTDSGGDASDSGNGDFDLFRVIIEATRAFPISPQYVNIWVPFQGISEFDDLGWTGGVKMQLIIYAAEYQSIWEVPVEF